MPLIEPPLASSAATFTAYSPCPLADWYTVNTILPSSIAAHPSAVASTPSTGASAGLILFSAYASRTPSAIESLLAATKS